jgi:hypothetical protein
MSYILVVEMFVMHDGKASNSLMLPPPPPPPLGTWQLQDLTRRFAKLKESAGLKTLKVSRNCQCNGIFVATYIIVIILCNIALDSAYFESSVRVVVNPIFYLCAKIKGFPVKSFGIVVGMRNS